jgi:transmembrane sensor
VVGVLWFWGPSADGSQNVSAQAREIFRTEEGERATIRLSDGTRAELNVNSRLTLPETFGTDRRVVKLKGEAFFEVVPDSTRPFIVQAGGTVTQVLGTEFGVRAYPEDAGAKVVVSEGRVTLGLDDEHAGRKEEEQESKDVMLTARQRARFLRSGERAIHRESDLSQHLAWMEEEIVFDGASFDKVTRVLERWYSLDIALEEEEASPSGHLNSRFSGESQDLREVLNVVATAFRLKYERQGKKVIFRRLE